MTHQTRQLTREAGPVRVRRKGNTRTLTVPAGIASAARIEVGDKYMVETINGLVIYRPVAKDRPPGRFVGEGCQRYLELPRGATMPAGPDPVPRALIDWDF